MRAVYEAVYYYSRSSYINFIRPRVSKSFSANLVCLFCMCPAYCTEGAKGPLLNGGTVTEANSTLRFSCPAGMFVNGITSLNCSSIDDNITFPKCTSKCGTLQYSI